MPCRTMLCYAMLCYAMLCYAMLCCAMLCCAMLAVLRLLHAYTKARSGVQTCPDFCDDSAVSATQASNI